MPAVRGACQGSGLRRYAFDLLGRWEAKPAGRDTGDWTGRRGGEPSAGMESVLRQREEQQKKRGRPAALNVAEQLLLKNVSRRP